ncbi:hypothetical protein UlMin_030357 [Ulmus minor]
MSSTHKNIVLFPYMAQGHIIPFLALANLLQQRENYTITIVSTPLNIQKIKLSLPSNTPFRFLSIPFSGFNYGLPPGVENTDSIPYNLLPNLLEASISLKPHFRNLISSLFSDQNGLLRPICIIADMFFGWSAEIANEFGIFLALFVSGGGFGFGCYYSLFLNLPHRSSNSDEFTFPDFPEASTFHVTQVVEILRKADGSEKFVRFLQEELSQWGKADGILFNTVEELDKTGLDYFRRKLGRKIWAIGPVLRSGKEVGIKSEMCLKWLDSKPAKSVLFISFGSQNTIAASQMMEFAIALERSKKNFIWVVRPPVGFDINGEFNAGEWLPEGFEKKIREMDNRGLLVQKWAPQVEILSHEACSCFLSHCGWNSVLEAFIHGVPILGWPLAAEQFYNSRLLEEELGVCVEIARGKSCEIRHEDMVENIELVMGETEKGREMRRRCCEIKEMIKNAIKDDEKGFKGSSVSAMDEFLNASLSKSEKLGLTQE